MNEITVLLVDDNPTFIEAIGRFLQQQGVSVVGFATGGGEALACVDELQPQIVLLDLAMQDISGLELIPVLRTQLPNVRIIALTFLDTSSYREAALAAGADAFVSKCRLTSELMSAIRRVVKLKPCTVRGNVAHPLQDAGDRAPCPENGSETFLFRRQDSRAATTTAETAEEAPSGPIEEAVALLAQQIVELTSVDCCTVARWDREQNTVETWIEYHRQPIDSFVGLAGICPLDDLPVTRAVLEANRPCIVYSSDPDVHPAESQFMLEAGIASSLMLPLWTHGRVIGLVRLVQSDQRRKFTAEQISFCQALTGQAAITIENAKLYEQAQSEIAERKKVEEELRRLKEFKERIVQTVDEGIVLVDANGCLTFVNPAAMALLGYTEKELIGKHWSLVVPADQQAIVHAADERRIRGEGDRYELELLRRDGRRILVLMSGRPWYQQDQFGGSLAVFTDLSERIRAEEQLRASKIQLEYSHEALANRVAELEALHHIGVAMSSTLDTETILQLIVDLAKALVDAANCYVLLLDEETSDLVCQAATERMVGMRIPANQDIAGRILQQGAPYISHEPVEDWASCTMIGQESGTPTRSLIATPLVNEDIAVGVLAAVDGRPEHFSEQDCDLFRTLANQAAMAIRNARLYEAQQQQRALAESLCDTAAALNSTLDFDTLLDRILANVGRVVPHNQANIMLVESGIASVVRSRGYGARRLEDVMPALQLPVADTPNLQQMAETGQCCSILDTESYSGWVAIPEMSWVRSYAGAPILLDGKTIGFLNLDSASPGELTPAHAERLQAFADQAAVAIDNARLYEQAQREITERLRLEERLAGVHRLGQELTLLRDERIIVQRTLQAAADALPTEFVAFGQIDEEAGELVYEHRLIDGRLEEIGLRLPLDGDRGIGVAVIRSNKALIVPDTRQDPRFVAPPGEDIRSELCVPMNVSERTIGVLNLASTRSDQYTFADQQLLQILADQAAVGLENAHLYKGLQEQVQTIQNTQARLIQSEKTAAMGRLLASIAHEINNPLQSVLGCLTLAEEELAEGQRHEEVRPYLEVASSEIERIASIVQRTRDFYRPAPEGQQLTDVHAVLDSVLALSGKQLQHSRVTVKRQWSSDLPKILANPDHLRQVFLNLVLNAKDAMPQGGMLHLCTAAAQVQGGGLKSSLPAIRITFRDTGLGMSPETQSRLFEPFFTTKEQGMGLGLSISYSIIKSHRGQISVESQTGEGTTFTILLPATDPRQPVKHCPST
jgi:PAS domain S-box-containing protein